MKKKEVNLNYIDRPTLDRDETLYVPNKSGIDNCNAYWLATPCNNYMYYVDFLGAYIINMMDGPSVAVRPIVKLPTNIIGTVKDTVEI